MAQHSLVRLLLVTATATAVMTAALPAQAPSISDRAAQMLATLGVPEAPTPVRQWPGWKRPTRILVNGLNPARLAELQAIAPGVEFLPARADAAATADALIGSCNAAVIAAGTSLRWIQSIGAGVEDCLESPAIRERGILLTNVQRLLAPTMAEHVMSMALAFARRLPVYRDNQREGVWRRDQVPAFTLEGKTMLLVGLGGVGTEIAQRAHAFKMNVIAIRNSDRPGPPTVSRVGQTAALPDFLKDADIVVNTLPLTDETTNMFDAKLFAAMKPEAYFINVGRGGTVVTADLVQALQSGRIAGAALDVTEPEPLPAGHPLWAMSNVIITPHVAPNSEVNNESRWALFRENLRRYVAGDPMLSVVDTTRGY